MSSDFLIRLTTALASQYPIESELGAGGMAAVYLAHDAAERARWMVARVPILPYTAQLSSLVDAMEGRTTAALDALARVNVAPLDAHHTFHLSESFAMAGDTARALALLERAVDRGFYPSRYVAEWCPFMAPLRGMPEFVRITANASCRVVEFSA